MSLHHEKPTLRHGHTVIGEPEISLHHRTYGRYIGGSDGKRKAKKLILHYTKSVFGDSSTIFRLFPHENLPHASPTVERFQSAGNDKAASSIHDLSMRGSSEISHQFLSMYMTIA